MGNPKIFAKTSVGVYIEHSEEGIHLVGFEVPEEEDFRFSMIDALCRKLTELVVDNAYGVVIIFINFCEENKIISEE